MCTGGPCRYWLPQIHERGAKKESQIHGRSLCRRLGGMVGPGNNLVQVFAT